MNIISMRVTSLRTVLFILSIALFIILNGCIVLKKGIGTQQSITLSESDSLVTLLGGSQFTKFTGTYPDNWPKWFKLPDTFYVNSKGNGIVYKDKSNNLSVSGLVVGSPAEVIDYFKQMLQNNSIKANVDSSEYANLSSHRIVSKDAPNGIDELAIDFDQSSTDSKFTGIHIVLWLAPAS